MIKLSNQMIKNFRRACTKKKKDVCKRNNNCDVSKFLYSLSHKNHDERIWLKQRRCLVLIKARGLESALLITIYSSRWGRRKAMRWYLKPNDNYNHEFFYHKCSDVIVQQLSSGSTWREKTLWCLSVIPPSPSSFVSSSSSSTLGQSRPTAGKA